MMKRLLAHAAESPCCAAHVAERICAECCDDSDAAATVALFRADPSTADATFAVLLFARGLQRASAAVLSPPVAELLFACVSADPTSAPPSVPAGRFSRETVALAATELSQVACAVSDPTSDHAARLGACLTLLPLLSDDEATQRAALDAWLQAVLPSASDAVAAAALSTFLRWRLAEKAELWLRLRCVGSFASAVALGSAAAASDTLRRRLADAVLAELVLCSPLPAFAADAAMLKECLRTREPALGLCENRLAKLVVRLRFLPR